MEIQLKSMIVFWLAIVLFLLGLLSLGRMFAIESKFIACFNISVFLIFLAALLYEISFKSNRVWMIKLMRFITWMLLFGVAVSLFVFPWVVAQLNCKADEGLITIINLGFILLLLVIKEAVREWKAKSPRRIKLPSKDQTLSYFEALPKITQKRKKPIYFDFK